MMKHVKVHVQEVTREGWMKHVPNGREESVKGQPGIGTREPMRKQPGSGTPGPMKKEHSQQQADKYL